MPDNLNDAPCDRQTDAIAIRTELRPGDLGRLVAFHGTAFEDDALHFGVRFEAFVARLMADFVLGGASGRIFIAERGDALVGCAAMVEQHDKEDATPRGQLRWVLADPSVRGTGLGERLVRDAIDYAREQEWREVILETTEGLDASMGLYRKLGFTETGRTVEPMWRGDVTVIRMSLVL